MVLTQIFFKNKIVGGLLACILTLIGMREDIFKTADMAEKKKIHKYRHLANNFHFISIETDT